MQQSNITIKKLTRMLDNPGFTRMTNPEEPEKIHNTLVEIDKLIEDIFIDQEVINTFREIRGPWEDLYKTNSKSREKFVLRVRDFRNYLVNRYNRLIESHPDLGLNHIELDKKDYQISE